MLSIICCKEKATYSEQWEVESRSKRFGPLTYSSSTWGIRDESGVWNTAVQNQNKIQAILCSCLHVWQLVLNLQHVCCWFLFIRSFIVTHEFIHSVMTLVCVAAVSECVMWAGLAVFLTCGSACFRRCKHRWWCIISGWFITIPHASQYQNPPPVVSTYLTKWFFSFLHKHHTFVMTKQTHSYLQLFYIILSIHYYIKGKVHSCFDWRLYEVFLSTVTDIKLVRFSS